MSRPRIEEFEPQTLERDWGQEILIAHTPTYLGKVLVMNAGTKGGLQVHVEKEETFYLLRGEAVVDFEGEDGKLQSLEMRPSMSIHVPAGAVHRTRAITDCVFFECSTPHFDDRIRMEEEFGEQVLSGLPTTR